MSSPTNCQTSPHAIIHHQSNQSAASDSNERIVPKESNNLENHGQILDDTLLQNSHGITRLVYRFTQALHVCFTTLLYDFSSELLTIFETILNAVYISLFRRNDLNRVQLINDDCQRRNRLNLFFRI